MMHEKSETLLILQLKYGMPRRIGRYIVPLLCRREHRIYLLHIRRIRRIAMLAVTEHVFSIKNNTTAAWRNGIASDYESGDCRFDPCGGHSIFFCY